MRKSIKDMRKPTKYELPEEEILTVSENLDAATADMVLSQTLLSPIHEADEPSRNMAIPSLHYSLEELNDRISKGIEQYRKGEYYTQEEAHALIARTLARTQEEYEDMKAHDFYSKGTPFPNQPQTWDEVWKEVDNHEKEIYLDETEANKAMERLWSVLA